VVKETTSETRIATEKCDGKLAEQAADYATHKKQRREDGDQ